MFALKRLNTKFCSGIELVSDVIEEDSHLTPD